MTTSFHRFLGLVILLPSSSPSLAFMLKTTPPSVILIGSRNRHHPKQQQLLLLLRQKSSLLSLSDDDDDNNHNHNNDNHNNNNIRYNDFDFVIGEDNDNHHNSLVDQSSEIIASRMNELQQQEIRESTRISNNWKTGHWGVRGCSLDPTNENDENDENDDSSSSEHNNYHNAKIKISSLCPLVQEDDDDDDDNIDTSGGGILLVGRTDGSICWLQLGNKEYLASFTNQFVAKWNNEGRRLAADTNNNTIAIQQALKRNDNNDPSNTGDRDDDDNGESFQILGQLQAAAKNEASISKMVVSRRHDYLFVLSTSNTNTNTNTMMIQQYAITNVGPASDHEQPPVVLLETTTTTTTTADEDDDELVGMDIFDVDDDEDQSSSYLISTSRNGQVTIWNIGKKTTSSNLSIPTTQRIIHIMENIDNDRVLSTHVDSKYLYVGTQEGFVWVYSLKQFVLLLQEDDDKEDEASSSSSVIVPLKSFQAFSNGGVSAICASGKGTMGRGSTGLVTGSTTGGIKQWELIPRGKEEALEYWPKMSSQSLPGGKAHILGNHHHHHRNRRRDLDNTSSDSSDGGEPTIWDLQVVMEDVLLSATSSRLTLWNTVTGQSYFHMDGLEFELNDSSTSSRTTRTLIMRPSCIVVSSHLLVTNGMDQYVCVHDFSVPALENLDDDYFIEREDDDGTEDF